MKQRKFRVRRVPKTDPMERALQEQREKGRVIGHSKGHAEGFAEGFAEGKERGREQGIAVGRYLAMEEIGETLGCQGSELQGLRKKGGLVLSGKHSPYQYLVFIQATAEDFQLTKAMTADDNFLVQIHTGISGTVAGTHFCEALDQAIFVATGCGLWDPVTWSRKGS